MTINNNDKSFTFFWDNEDHRAKLVAFRTNHFVRFEYFPENQDDENDPSYIELRLEVNELTQSTYLKILDYSDFDDQKELHALWDSLVEQLRKIVGG